MERTSSLGNRPYSAGLAVGSNMVLVQDRMHTQCGCKLLYRVYRSRRGQADTAITMI
jgi:hypothetical protein